MSDSVDGRTSKTTFERAASGASTQAWETVETYVELTMTREEEFTGSIGAAVDQARRLWIKARRATRAPYYLHKAPDPELISNRADFSRTRRDQHVWAGCPSPGEMSQASGPGMLPKTTAYRIINGRMLPVTPEQALAFLQACYVFTPEELTPWLAAGVRISAGTREHADWVKTHSRLQERITEDRGDISVVILKAVA
ncbi:hypothetical protein AB0L14_39785 [Streptomyces sp. NPDC052727]|uniref:hypothetical protein n=1 Tax=Streptomyces sp. NPDC052727 TaxID=3154854 RepID=UPI0034142680